MQLRQPQVDVYIDTVQISISGYDTTLGLVSTFPASSPLAGVEEYLGTIRMSHETAKAFAIVLRRALKAYEDKAGPIQLTAEAQQGSGINLSEDWI